MFNYVLSLVKCILDYLLFFWFSMLFFRRRWENRNALSLLVLVVLAMLLNLVNSLCIPILNTLAAFVSVLIINFLLYTGPVKARLICTAAEVLMGVICEIIPITVYSLLHNTSIPSANSETITNAGLNLISTCITSIIILGIRHAIIHKNQTEDNDITIPDNLTIMAVPLVSILTLYHIFSFDIPTPAASLQSLFVFLGILCMNVAVIMGDNNTRKHHQLLRELDRLHGLEQLNQAVIGQQDQYIQEMKGFAHDYAKQLEGIKKLIQTKDSPASEDIQNYAVEMQRHMEEHYRFAFIPSPALRTILTQAQLRCNSSHIRLETDIQYGDFSFISFPDLYTLFENPLENAITACNELQDGPAAKRICLRIFKEKDLIWVEIKNPKSNAILIKDHSIQTTKKDTAAHGLGLKNMRRVIERYSGYLNIDYDSNEFTVTMAIPVMAE